MKTEVLTLNKERNVTLTTYIQDCGGRIRLCSQAPNCTDSSRRSFIRCVRIVKFDPVAFAFAKSRISRFRSALFCYGRLYMAKSTQ